MVSLPDLLLPKVKYFGIAIDKTTIRATELDNRNGIRALAEVRIPEELFLGSILVKPDVFVTALKNLFTAGKFTTQYVNVCFPESYAFTKETTLPKVPIEEVQEAIGWQVNNFFPFPKEDIYYDWKILHESPSEYKLVVVAIQKSVLDPLVSAIVEAGLKPLRFEPDASAIARLVSLKQDQYALVTDINPKGAYVTLVEGEKAVFTTVVNVASTDTRASYIANITASVTDIGAYYKQKKIVDESISVILTGELATEELAKEIAGLLPYGVKILNTQIRNPAFNKAYAAATASIARPIDERSINLIPQTLQREYDEERSLLLYTRLAFRFLLFIGCMTVVSVVLFITTKVKEQDLANRQKTLTNLVKLEGASQQRLLLLNAQAREIVNLAPLRVTPKQKLSAIAALISQAITITGWEYDDTKLEYTLNGIAVKRDDLLAFKDRLEASSDFAAVTIPLASLESAENVKFTISFVTR